MVKRFFTTILAIVVMAVPLVACSSPAAEDDSPTAEVQTKNDDFVSIELTQEHVTPLAYNPKSYEANVKDYQIESDLANVENLSLFGDFSAEEMKSLSENGFILTETWAEEMKEYGFMRYEQIFHIYDDNHYMHVPSFITTDSVTHLFHIFYDGLLRELEEDMLYPLLQDITEEMLTSTQSVYRSLEDGELQKLQLKNIAMFATGAELLSMDTSSLIEDDIRPLIEDLLKTELDNTQSLSQGTSAITENNLDYSQLTPRGHYTRSDVLEKYFTATMYYGQVALHPVTDEGPNEPQLLQSILMAHSLLNSEEGLTKWKMVTDPIEFLVESAEDLSIREYQKLIQGVYGDNYNVNDLKDSDKLQVFANSINELPKPLIQPYLGYSFRFIPQRAVMDNVYGQNLVDINPNSQRPIYSGLDIMATFGNEKAKEILEDKQYYSQWDDYLPRLEENIELADKLEFTDWSKNLYRGWLWMLQAYNQNFKEGYPMFMQNEAWKTKDLISALGSYTELKHDTVLYGQQLGAQMGGDFFEDMPKGYVEPNVELYQRLSWLLEYTTVNLKERDLLDQERESKLANFKELVDALADMSIKELNNEPLDEMEYNYLHEIGGYMESISLDFVEPDPETGFEIYSWHDLANATDRNMPVVVDLMAVVSNSVGLPEGTYQTIGSGLPMEIFVIYPIDGKLYMGRGGVFSYHEFLANERMTDEDWQQSLIEEPQEYPEWYEDLVYPLKDNIVGDTPIW